MTFELRTIGPTFFALAMIQVILPVSFVVRAISMSKEASSMRLVVFPLALEYGTVCVDHSAAPIRHVILPVAFVDRAVFPGLHSAAVSLAVDPLALELAAIW